VAAARSSAHPTQTATRLTTRTGPHDQQPLAGLAGLLLLVLPPLHRCWVLVVAVAVAAVVQQHL
jgi:hypothetical protein